MPDIRMPLSRPASIAAATLFGVLALAGCAQNDLGGGAGSPRLADAALTAGYPQMALNVADGILARDSGNVPALAARGDALYALGRTEEAATAYRKALARRPEDATANAGLGRILLKSDPNAAARLLRASLATRPDDPVVLANLGVALDLQERHLEAQAQYRRSLQLAPNVTATKANLGLSLALSGDSAGAQAVLAPLAAAPDASASVHDNLAVARLLATAPGARPAPALAPQSVAPLAPSPLAPTPLTPRTDASRPPGPQSAAPQAAPALPPQAALEAPAPAARFAQLASVDSEAAATAFWRHVLAGNRRLLAGYQPQISPASVHGRAYWRVRVQAASLTQARGLCARLHRRGVSCWVDNQAGA